MILIMLVFSKLYCEYFFVNNDILMLSKNIRCTFNLLILTVIFSYVLSLLAILCINNIYIYILCVYIYTVYTYSIYIYIYIKFAR